MLLRDPRMNVGRIKVHVPPVPRIQQAIFTTPGARPAGTAPVRFAKRDMTTGAVNAHV
jgi:hypothetical protein